MVCKIILASKIDFVRQPNFLSSKIFYDIHTHDKIQFLYFEQKQPSNNMLFNLSSLNVSYYTK